MDTGAVRIGPLICFESAFPDMSRSEVRDGAQLLVYETNTSTFQGAWAQPQHAALAAVRAAETGRPAVHVGLTGDSAVFDARGRQLAWRGSSFRGGFVVDVPLVVGRTPFDAVGNWFLLGAFAVVVLAVAREVRDYRAQAKRSA
jgi:apolipoprotein N-acyltransferase